MAEEYNPSISPPFRTKEDVYRWHRAASGIDDEALVNLTPGTTDSNNSNGRGRPDEAPVPAPAVGMPKTSHYRAKGSIPNTPLVVSLISAGLGAVAGIFLFIAATPLLAYIGAADWSWVRPQLGIYIAAIATFHLLEFWTTAGWNYQKLSVDAFLLNNTRDYHLAHAFGITEYLISSYYWPSKFETVFASPPVLALIFIVMVVGQSFRSLAMVHAAQSFSHIVKRVKLEDHTLITHGVYAYARHPSYAGFFYWAIATQLFMSNVVSTVIFIGILGRFFYQRIKDEEVHLVRFFGDKYLDYRKKVGTGLFFVK